MVAAAVLRGWGVSGLDLADRADWEYVLVLVAVVRRTGSGREDTNALCGVFCFKIKTSWNMVLSLLLLLLPTTTTQAL